MITIGALAKRFGLSRSTLLYYDRRGLLRPSARSDKGYRHYAQADSDRLERICLFRDAGIPLDDIAGLLDTEEAGDDLDRVLRRRLADLASEMSRLRDQQRLVASMLTGAPPADAPPLDRRTWSDLLAASGFSDADMRRWHVAFERRAPARHQAFLRFLGIPEDEIAEIRGWTA
jgi:DNA-binding transcriptional MerR regulator